MTPTTVKKTASPKAILADINARLKAKGLKPLTTGAALEQAKADAAGPARRQRVSP